jgi:CRP-like cAMP-binding protein
MARERGIAGHKARSGPIPISATPQAAGVRRRQAAIPKVLLRVVVGRHAILQYGPNHVVFLQGSPAEAIFFVCKGRVKLTVSSSQGKSAILAILGPGQFFGEGCLAGQSLRMATATTMSEASLIRIPRKTMIGLLPKRQTVANLFTSHLLSRNARVEEDLIHRSFDSSEKRLARALLQLASSTGEGGSERMIPNVSQRMLAEMIGTTRARVSFFMTKFRKLGLIDYNGGLLIHPLLLNTVLLG